MTRHSRPIDQRPFQTKAALEGQTALERHYRQIAIDEVVAALHHLKAAAEPRAETVAKAA